MLGRAGGSMRYSAGNDNQEHLLSTCEGPGRAAVSLAQENVLQVLLGQVRLQSFHRAGAF